MHYNNVRSQYKDSITSNGKKELNPYWEMYLNDRDKDFIAGFDICAEDCVAHFFSNLEVFEEELLEVGIKPDEIDYDLLMSDEEISESTFNAASTSTKLMHRLRELMMISIEMDRDEIVTELFDHMPEEEYEANVKKVTEELNKEGTPTE